MVRHGELRRFCRMTDVSRQRVSFSASASSWFMLSTHIGRADGYFYGPYRTESDPSTVWLADLIEAAEVLAASAEPCDPATVRAFSHRLEMPGLPLLRSEVPFIGASPKLR